MESISRPGHNRSKSSPVPSSKPWGEELITSSASMILPCGSSGSMCGFGEVLDGMMSSHEDDFHVEDTTEYETNMPPPESTITPNKTSSDGLCQQTEASPTQGQEKSAAPPVSPQGCQKRGRFLIWPVTMEPPTMVGLPFFGMTHVV